MFYSAINELWKAFNKIQIQAGILQEKWKHILALLFKLAARILLDMPHLNCYFAKVHNTLDQFLKGVKG